MGTRHQSAPIDPDYCRNGDRGVRRRDRSSRPQEKLQHFNLLAAERFKVQSCFGPIDKLPLSTIFDALVNSWTFVSPCGQNSMLYYMGEKVYKQLLKEEESTPRQFGCGASA